VNQEEIENYLDAIEWFDRKYKKEDTVRLISEMNVKWPNETVIIANQRFFKTILGSN